MAGEKAFGNKVTQKKTYARIKSHQSMREKFITVRRELYGVEKELGR